MAYTLDEQSDLIYNTVVRWNSTAEDAYLFAKGKFDELADIDRTLELGVVDVDIGADTVLTWAATYLAPDTPEEPTFDGDVDDPTMPSVTVPAAVGVDTRPTWDVDLTGTPADLDAYTFSELPTLETIPEIDVTIPTIDLSELEYDPLEDFIEPVYVERVSPTIKTEILRVLEEGGGLPQAYWDTLYTQAATRIGREQATALRNARNRGAAGFWPLPSEAVLSASRQVQDEGKKRLAEARVEITKQQAEAARQDFWSAVEKGIAYEQQWLDAHHKMADRALKAAEQVYRVRIEVHNAEIARYNLLLEAAKQTGVIANLQVQRALAKMETQLKLTSIEVAQAGYYLDEFKTKWAGYQIEKTTAVTAMAEQIKFWLGEVDADTKYQTLEQQKGKLDLEKMATQVSQVVGLAKATADLLGARIASAKLDMEKQTVEHEWEKDINVLEMERTKVTQAAQESRAKIDVAQSQYLLAHQIGLKTNMAQLAYGYAQAAITAADVSLGKSLSSGYSETSSHNAELVW